MEKIPYTDEKINNKTIRTFKYDVESEELKWHQDLRNRKITVIESDGWKFQMEDSLPRNMEKNDVIEIPALKWHRAIKGHGDLVVEIEEKPT